MGGWVGGAWSKKAWLALRLSGNAQEQVAFVALKTAKACPLASILARLNLGP